VFETLETSRQASTARAKRTARKKPPERCNPSKNKACAGTGADQKNRAAQQASKMEAIGQLAGGIAHDFNNLLTVVLGHCEFLLKRDEPKESSRQRVEEIRKAAERGAWLTNQLLAYSRNQILEPAVLQINSVLEDMDGILRCVLGEDIAMDVVMDSNLGWTRVDRGKLQQIVLNLAGNARDAMPQGGRLRLETLNVHVNRQTHPAQPYVAPGEYVALLVRDTGIGMDSETRARVFEPFFTTKEKGKGTGLGLATVYGIVKQSGGYIWVESEIGAGSAFQTLLPRVAQPADPYEVQESLDFNPGSETILLVEDEPAVRRMAAEVLLNIGYRVIAAPSGADALRMAAKHEGPLDLLLTDVVMPGMTGPELARQFHSKFPRMRILYMSGYTDDAIEKHGLRGRTVRLLQKPFTHETLARGIREALGPVAQASVAAEKLATCHSEGSGLPEESAFSRVWRRKADPSLRSG
jgi:nitrogen-specific signal transduction histidine kinase/CheY-like chemotaxis protein